MDTPSPAVLLVAENGDSGGLGRYCADLAGALGERARVACLCPIPCPGEDGCWLAGKCAARRAQLLKVDMPPKDWRGGRSGLVDLWRRMRRPLIDVNGRRGNSIACAARLTVPGLHYVTTVHGVLGLHARRNALYCLVDLAAGQAANAVIAVSADTGRRLIRAGSPRTRTHVISNGIADDGLARLRAVADRREGAVLNGRHLRLGFLGRLSPEKGTRELLAVSRRPFESGANASVAIAGDGPDRQWLEAESHAMTQSGFMSYVGVVQSAADSLGHVDVLVMPSRNEGMPYVLLEAMAAGCAVVAFGVGGIPEVIAAPTLGVVVQPGDADGLTAALGRLCDSLAEARSIGRAAADHVREHYALRTRLPSILQAYALDVKRAPGSSGQPAADGDE